MSRNKCVQGVFGTGLSNTVVGSGSVARSPAAEWHRVRNTHPNTAVTNLNGSVYEWK